jgi:enterochelin esterase-like enzyme
MARLARRREDPTRQPRAFSRLPIQWRWLWAVVALAVAVLLVFWLEGSTWWSSLRSTIQSLNFDPSRADLILAWLAGMTLAGVATLLGGRPWIAALTATLFTAATYVWPFGDRLRQEVPMVFGLKETFQPAALWHNQAVALGVALVAALVAAATADLVRRGAIGVGTAAWRVARSRRVKAAPLLALGATVAIGLTALTGLVLATGVDPVLRYGPEYGVYLPPVVSAQPEPAPAPNTSGQPAASPEPIPAHGQLLEKVYHSQAMGEDRHFMIYLPPSYGLKAAARRHYPVLYLLHGDPGGPFQWLALSTPALFEAGVAAGVTPETILVMPDGNGHVTSATQWANRFDGRDRIEDALIELVDQIDIDYRTIPDPGHRLIAGLSSGAFGAVNIAARHPSHFGIAMSFSGYFVATGPVFGGNSDYIRVNSPYYLVQDQVSARTVHYILVVGNRDPYFLRTNRAFDDVLTQLGVSHDLNIVAGGHGDSVWQAGLTLGMSRMGKTVSTVVVEPIRGSHYRPL